MCTLNLCCARRYKGHRGHHCGSAGFSHCWFPEHPGGLPCQVPPPWLLFVLFSFKVSYSQCPFIVEKLWSTALLIIRGKITHNHFPPGSISLGTHSSGSFSTHVHWIWWIHFTLHKWLFVYLLACFPHLIICPHFCIFFPHDTILINCK